MEENLIPAPIPPTVRDVADLAEAVSLERYGPSSEFRRVQYCCALLRTFCGPLPAERFGPNALRSLQQAMVAGWSNGTPKPPLARREVNRRIGTIRRCFRIAVARELIHAGVIEALRALEPLRRGHTPAVERMPVRPVTEETWRTTVAHLGPVVRSMVELQAVVGMRSGELCAMRAGDVDRSATTWVFRPRLHKGLWRDQPREIAIGPRGRAILGPMLEGLGADDYVFSPKRQRSAKPGAGRPPGECYTVPSYARAIARACAAAGIDKWRPYRLRHLVMTRVRDTHGLDGAQVIGGHRHASTSELYADLNRKRAAEIAEDLG